MPRRRRHLKRFGRGYTAARGSLRCAAHRLGRRCLLRLRVLGRRRLRVGVRGRGDGDELPRLDDAVDVCPAGGVVTRQGSCLDAPANRFELAQAGRRKLAQRVSVLCHIHGPYDCLPADFTRARERPRCVAGKFLHAGAPSGRASGQPKGKAGERKTPALGQLQRTQTRWGRLQPNVSPRGPQTAVSCPSRAPGGRPTRTRATGSAHMGLLWRLLPCASRSSSAACSGESVQNILIQTKDEASRGPARWDSSLHCEK